VAFSVPERRRQEAGGILDTILLRLAVFLERRRFCRPVRTIRFVIEVIR
jgi:hypothetical protein